MNADGIVRMMTDHGGQRITLRRWTGTGAGRTSYDVPGILSVVFVGGASVLTDEVQQTADRVLMTMRELDAARQDPPSHGDQIVYADGRVMTVQGVPDIRTLDGGDRVIRFHTVGG